MAGTASNLLFTLFFSYFSCLFPEFSQITLGFYQYEWVFGEKTVLFSIQGKF